MKIVILGGGSIGGSVASELSSEDNDVFVIDNNDDVEFSTISGKSKSLIYIPLCCLLMNLLGIIRLTFL